MSDLQRLLQQMIQGWRNEDIPILPGVDEARIADFERRYGIKLPADMREYFLTVNGMGHHYDDENFFRFWPFEEVASVEDYQPELMKVLPECAGHFFFFDYSIDLFMYAIRLRDSESSAPQIAKVYPQIPTNECSFDVFSGSFTEFLKMYVNNPSDLI
jgi:hypothetical protein